MKKPTFYTALLASFVPGLLAGPALADPGHIGLLNGHDHWVAGIAVGAAIGVSIWGALKERRKAGKKKAKAAKGKQKPQEA